MFGVRLMKLLLKAVFVSDGKDTQSFYFGAVLHTIRKDLTIAISRRQRRRREMLITLLKR